MEAARAQDVTPTVTFEWMLLHIKTFSCFFLCLRKLISCLVLKWQILHLNGFSAQCVRQCLENSVLRHIASSYGHKFGDVILPENELLISLIIAFVFEIIDFHLSVLMRA